MQLQLIKSLQFSDGSNDGTPSSVSYLKSAKVLYHYAKFSIQVTLVKFCWTNNQTAPKLHFSLINKPLCCCTPHIGKYNLVHSEKWIPSAVIPTSPLSFKLSFTVREKNCYCGVIWHMIDTVYTVCCGYSWSSFACTKKIWKFNGADGQKHASSTSNFLQLSNTFHQTGNQWGILSLLLQ